MAGLLDWISQQNVIGAGKNALTGLLQPTNSIFDALVAERNPQKAKDIFNKKALQFYQQAQTPEGALDVALNFAPMGVLAPKKYLGKTLKGLPSKVDVGGKIDEFGTDQRIVDTAKQYMADRGMNYIPLNEYTQVDVKRAKKIADAFEKMKNNPSDPKVKKAYDALIDETMAQYEAARKSGIKFEFMPEGVDVYGNPRNAINDLILNRRMYVFPTESGFGTLNKASETNPLLQRTGEYWNGKPVTANDMFRAVHDVFGHAKHGVGFRATGEENAFQSHARMFSPEALPALATETRGQNSWLNYGPYGVANRTANTADTIFADQKIGLLPEFAWMEGLLK
jgi:hypothetical protein